MGGAERRQPGRGSPCPHFIVADAFAVFSLAVPAGERRQQRPRGGGERARERARERAGAAAHHALLRLHGAGHGVPSVPEQPRIQTHRLNVNHTPKKARPEWELSPDHHTLPWLGDGSGRGN